MISGFVAQKGSMTNIYLDSGKRIAVTNCRIGPVFVTQVKESAGKDGYDSVQIAYGQKKRLDRAVSEKINKLKLEIAPKFFKEFAPTGQPISVGQQIEIDSVLQEGDKVVVTGISKGRGFAGVIKRHGFHRQPVSGGQSDRVRAPGSIGAQTPGKVVKGKKMPGHYGNVSKTIRGLKIVSINKDKGLISLSGPVPGSVGAWLLIKKDVR